MSLCTKTSRSIKALHSRSLYTTCLAHAFHNACEEVRAHFPNADCLIAEMTKSFPEVSKMNRYFKCEMSD